ncbi:GlsB/YeaQ/YmgE family stress response membrane protein [Verrucomicrobiales bacterium]|jgi:uncharacterized membrane protein YeaQ/YmgE (transglycosylase-associated protein family)|nr:GlsB/YeaQ/YmgE family stress response membrane protein [Verrucomicrobiales bacterium]
MEWIITLAVGFVAGALGKFLVPGKDPSGCLITTILGVVGAVVGKFVAGALGLGMANASGFNLPSIAVSVVGVVILLLAYRFLFKGKKKK